MKAILGVALLLTTFSGRAYAAREPGVRAMPAYYDGKVFTINFTELPSGGETATHAHNTQLNTIYQCDACAGLLPGGAGFVSVIDAIQTEGFNPIWEEFQITFTAGHAPRQLFSDDEVLAAAAAGEITLTDTDEMYICAVLGRK